MFLEVCFFHALSGWYSVIAPTVGLGDWHFWHLPGLVSYGSAGGGNWIERLPVRFKWLAAA